MRRILARWRIRYGWWLEGRKHRRNLGPRVSMSNTESFRLLDMLMRVRQPGGRVDLNWYFPTRPMREDEVREVLVPLLADRFIVLEVNRGPRGLTPEQVDVVVSGWGGRLLQTQLGVEPGRMDLDNFRLTAWITTAGVKHYFETLDSDKRRFFDRYGIWVGAAALVLSIISASISWLDYKSGPTQVQLSLPPVPVDTVFVRVVGAPDTVYVSTPLPALVAAPDSLSSSGDSSGAVRTKELSSDPFKSGRKGG